MSGRHYTLVVFPEAKPADDKKVSLQVIADDL